MTSAIRLDRFAGTVITGREDAVARLGELRDRRVGLLGDPATVTRMLAPVARRAAAVTVFQEQGVWVLPRLASPRLPGGDIAGRLLPAGVRTRLTKALATEHLRRGVSDPWTRRQLTPRHDPTRSTLVYSNSYHRALKRRNVRLVTWPVTRAVPAGVRTADGLEHHLDLIIEL